MVKRLVQQNQIQERILDAAEQLFYEKGLQAVSVDEISLQASIAKMTLYKHFMSKDYLIMALVERSEKRWWDWFTTKLGRRSQTTPKQLLAIFDLLIYSVEKDFCKSKLFINTSFRIVKTMHPIFLVSENFLKQVKDFVLDKAKLANIANPHQVTDQLMLLIVGVNALYSLNNAKLLKTSLYNAKKLAAMIINSATQS